MAGRDQYLKHLGIVTWKNQFTSEYAPAVHPFILTMLTATGIALDRVAIAYEQVVTGKQSLIIAFGLPAAHALLKTDLPLASLRQQVHHLPDSSQAIVVTFDPDELLQQPSLKKSAYHDLLFIKQLLEEETANGSLPSNCEQTL